MAGAVNCLKTHVGANEELSVGKVWTRIWETSNVNVVVRIVVVPLRCVAYLYNKMSMGAQAALEWSAMTGNPFANKTNFYAASSLVDRVSNLPPTEENTLKVVQVVQGEQRFFFRAYHDQATTSKEYDALYDFALKNTFTGEPLQVSVLTISGVRACVVDETKLKWEGNEWKAGTVADQRAFGDQDVLIAGRDPRKAGSGDVARLRGMIGGMESVLTVIDEAYHSLLAGGQVASADVEYRPIKPDEANDFSKAVEGIAKLVGDLSALAECDKEMLLDTVTRFKANSEALETVRGQLGDAERALDDAKSNHAEALRKIGEGSDKGDDAQKARIAQLEADLAAAQGRVGDLEAEVGKLNGAATAAAAAHKEAVTRAEAKAAAAVREELKTLQGAHGALEAEYDTLQGQVTEMPGLRKQLAAAKAKVADYDNVAAQLNSSQEAVIQLQAALAAARGAHVGAADDGAATAAAPDAGALGVSGLPTGSAAAAPLSAVADNPLGRTVVPGATASASAPHRDPSAADGKRDGADEAAHEGSGWTTVGSGPRRGAKSPDRSSDATHGTAGGGRGNGKGRNRRGGRGKGGQSGPTGKR